MTVTMPLLCHCAKQGMKLTSRFLFICPANPSLCLSPPHLSSPTLPSSPLPSPASLLLCFGDFSYMVPDFPSLFPRLIHGLPALSPTAREHKYKYLYTNATWVHSYTWNNMFVAQLVDRGERNHIPINAHHKYPQHTCKQQEQDMMDAQPWCTCTCSWWGLALAKMCPAHRVTIKHLGLIKRRSLWPRELWLLTYSCMCVDSVVDWWYTHTHCLCPFPLE